MEKRKWSDEEIDRWYQTHGGRFYFNREDSRILVRKRNIGLGWSFNWANPLSYAVQIGLMLLVFLIVFPISL